MSGPVKTAGHVARPQAVGSLRRSASARMNAAISFSVRPGRDEMSDELEDLLGRPDGLLHPADLGRGLALAEGRDDLLGRDEALGHPGLGQEFVERQVHAVGQAVADLARLGVVDGDRRGIELLQVLEERFLDAR